MIKFITIGFFPLLVLASCSEENLKQASVLSESISIAESACGTTELVWLQEIIKKAEEDKQNQTYKGNYIGRIYQEDYQGEVVFFVRMMMGSGGLYGYFYQCDGNQLDFSNDDPKEVESFLQSLEKGKIIYKNTPDD